MYTQPCPFPSEGEGIKKGFAETEVSATCRRNHKVKHPHTAFPIKKEGSCDQQDLVRDPSLRRDDYRNQRSVKKLARESLDFWKKVCGLMCGFLFGIFQDVRGVSGK
jgi:hypothetical protein